MIRLHGSFQTSLQNNPGLGGKVATRQNLPIKKLRQILERDSNKDHQKLKRDLQFGRQKV